MKKWEKNLLIHLFYETIGLFWTIKNKNEKHFTFKKIYGCVWKIYFSHLNPWRVCTFLFLVFFAIFCCYFSELMHFQEGKHKSQDFSLSIIFISVVSGVLIRLFAFYFLGQLYPFCIQPSNRAEEFFLLNFHIIKFNTRQAVLELSVVSNLLKLN